MDDMPHFTGLVASAAAIADRAVIADIELHAVQVGPRRDRCYEIRPMLDENEHKGEAIDMVEEALAYAIARGLIKLDEATPWLARILVPTP